MNQKYMQILKFIPLTLYLCVPMSGLASEGPRSKLSDLISNNSLMVNNQFGSMLIHFDTQGFFRQFGRQGAVGNGTWRVTNKSVCLTVTSIPPKHSPKEHCLKINERKLGSTWSADDPRNGAITYVLIEGHPDLKKDDP